MVKTLAKACETLNAKELKKSLQRLLTLVSTSMAAPAKLKFVKFRNRVFIIATVTQYAIWFLTVFVSDYIVDSHSKHFTYVGLAALCLPAPVMLYYYSEELIQILAFLKDSTTQSSKP